MRGRRQGPRLFQGQTEPEALEPARGLSSPALTQQVEG